MIKAYSKTQNLEAALSIFNLMLGGHQLSGHLQNDNFFGLSKQQIACIGQTIKPNIISFNSIIDCCVRCDQIQIATEIFELMATARDLKEQEESDCSEQNYGKQVKPDLITYSTLIKGHCRCQNIE